MSFYHVPEIRAIVREGRFEKALNLAESQRHGGLAVDVLRAYLLERTGRFAESGLALDRLSHVRGMSDSQRSLCEMTRGLLIWQVAGNARVSAEHLHRSIRLAVACEDLEQLCWSQLHLLNVQAESYSAAPIELMLREVRDNTFRLGDPQLVAALHIVLGVYEGKRGLWLAADRHLKRGLDLLRNDNNYWLESIAEIAKTALAIVTSDIESALTSANNAISLTNETGRSMAACLGNLGTLFLTKGNFSEAIHRFEAVLEERRVTIEQKTGVLDGLGCAYMAVGELEKAQTCFAQVSAQLKSDDDWRLYQNRHALLNSCRLEICKRSFDAASLRIDSVLRISEETEDRSLHASGMLVKAELLSLKSNGRDIVECFRLLHPPEHNPLWLARYEGILATSLASLNLGQVGTYHLERSRRILTLLQNASSRVELDVNVKEVVH